MNEDAIEALDELSSNARCSLDIVLDQLAHAMPYNSTDLQNFTESLQATADYMVELSKQTERIIEKMNGAIVWTLILRGDELPKSWEIS